MSAVPLKVPEKYTFPEPSTATPTPEASPSAVTALVHWAIPEAFNLTT